MKKRVTVIYAFVIILILAVFSMGAYYLNRPYMTVASAMTGAGRASKMDGTIDLKLGIDTSKLMEIPGIKDNQLAASQVEAIKSAVESSNVKVTINGTSDGKGRFLMDGSVELPQMLGSNMDFNVYVDGKDVWTKYTGSQWVKAENTEKQENVKINRKAALDFIKSCPMTSDGSIITITMKPKYDDIKKILPQETIDEFNKSANGSMTLEQAMNAISVQADLTIFKNIKFLIPRPYISKADIKIDGNLSKLAPQGNDTADEEKAILEAISFSAGGTVNVQQRAGLAVEKPSDLK